MTVNYFKSSKSNGNGGNNCVEVFIADDAVRVRDSKDPDGTFLIFTYKEWQAFISGVKDGEFDLP